MTRILVHPIINQYKHWPVEAIMTSAGRPPTLRNLVPIQRDANTFYCFPALNLTNLIATTLRTHFQTQDDFLRSLHRQQATPITIPLH
jgi:hypothetical protein